jgi:UDP-N-acetylmuramoyl-tripeptide--D-alanyl-D-alanine ligase
MNTLPELLPQLSQARLVAPVDMPVRRVHTDSRSLLPGDLFVALRGERFDAHDFLPQARAAGAVAAMAERGLAEAGLPGVEVPDARLALGELATLWRKQFTLGLIAVTGSNGKTTVTQMLAAILRAAVGDAAALATEGNFNNDIGVPLTLLRLGRAHRLAVVELGMNHPGEIAGLAAMAQPTVALVNNAQREHQEFMATVAAVAHENASAFQALPPDGIAVFPAGDAYTGLWQQRAAGRATLTFGRLADGADVHARARWSERAWALEVSTPQGPFHTTLSVAGEHNVRNALAATACAIGAGVALDAIARGLAAFVAVPGRSRVHALTVQGHALTLIDDSYNANPDSVRAAIDVLATLPRPRVLALGDMGEVGEQGLAFHDEVLRHALAQGIEHVIVTGAWMAQATPGLLATGGGRLRHHPQFDDLQADAMTRLPEAASVLVKGSRFMRMERLVQAILAAGASQEPNQEGTPHVA